MKKFYKILFFTTLTSSTLMITSSYSLFSAWMGLEINLLSIIPLMYNKNNILSAESAVKYFITQAMASALLLMAMIMQSKDSSMNFYMQETASNLVMNTAILTKMGMAPFHFWMPEIIEGISWMNTLLILTWQKIGPMILLMIMSMNLLYMQMIMIMSALISSMSSMNQTQMKKILVFSSINHMGWMLPSIILEYNVWILYFSVYTFITLVIISMTNKFKIMNLSQISQMKLSNENKFLMSISFLSLSGIPPFLGFMPKWLTVQILINQKMLWTTIALIILTLLMIFIYMRITFSLLVIGQNKQNWTETKNSSLMSTSVMNMSMIMALMIMTMVLNL